jgi:gluconate 2-dehydrogenase gamma chain
MSETKIGRREFLTSVSVVGAATASAHALAPVTAAAQTPPQTPDAHHTTEAAGYAFLKPAEQAFVETLVDHMVPKDELTGSGTEIGIATFIDRALAGSWGKGDRLYQQGPWQKGTPNQGYQLPLTPAELYRAGIEGSNTYCRKTFGRDFDRCSTEQKETFLKDLSAGKITFDGGLVGRDFFTMFYENVMEGLFADPIYGGNKDKVGWKMIGFPGVMANNAENVKNYSDGKRFPADPVSISDMS